LTWKQLLQLDHFRYTISFIQNKITILDEIAQSDNEDEPCLTSTGTELVAHIYLGSRKEEVTITEFAGSSAGNGLTYSVFRKMLEEFLNKFYQAHQLPTESYLKIHGNQTVMSIILLFGTANL
jgi:hypothetical protein